jgi:hypothetical protein
VLHLFDHTICPILLYGCENWGTLSAYKINNNNLSLFETFKDWDFEKLNIKFCKYLLGVNKKSTNIAVLSELGRYPIYLKLITQVLSYWHMLENEPSNLLKSAYEEYFCQQLTLPGRTVQQPPFFKTVRLYTVICEIITDHNITV